MNNKKKDKKKKGKLWRRLALTAPGPGRTAKGEGGHCVLFLFLLLLPRIFYDSSFVLLKDIWMIVIISVEN